MRVKTEAKRQAIVEAAAVVFIERGYEAASMAEIAARAGGSKATLYSYFPSKEELFLVVMQFLAEERMQQAYARLVPGDDLVGSLQAFGENFLLNVLSPELSALRGIVLSEGRRSGVGRLFFDNGPGRCWQVVADFLAGEMAAGRLRQARPWAATMHLIGLLEAEYQEQMIVGITELPAIEQIRDTVADAVKVFLAGYAPTA
ncbi:TetR/AcrR family transcriptional regulator [Vogesella oryzae]|uniref:TetR/AcrR family transcriptional regulator n=1 Tax=Vogesella oryzae TaxID=1735285 RepID=UPI001583F53C|nr:TetR/AcrR family transcriptional regulator [Vogesella oryzae]